MCIFIIIPNSTLSLLSTGSALTIYVNFKWKTLKICFVFILKRSIVLHKKSIVNVSMVDFFSNVLVSSSFHSDAVDITPHELLCRAGEKSNHNRKFIQIVLDNYFSECWNIFLAMIWWYSERYFQKSSFNRFSSDYLFSKSFSGKVLVFEIFLTSIMKNVITCFFFWKECRELNIY